MIALKMAAGAGLAMLVMECLLRVLPTSTATRMGYHIDPYVRTYPPGSSFVTSSQWDMRAPLRQGVNSMGFASSFERDRSKPGLAVVGDSFVEGLAVLEGARVTERLRQYLPFVDPVMLGSPGTSLIDYADRAKWASTALDIKDFVFFISVNDPNEALCGSGQHLRRCIHSSTHEVVEGPLLPRPKVVEVLSHFATLQYFFGHLKLSRDALKASLVPSSKRLPTSPESPTGRLASPASIKAIDFFLETVKRLPNARVLLVLDCDRRSMYQGRPADQPETYAVLKQRNTNYGFPVLELCPAFEAAYKKDGLRTEVSLTDGHWNARGHDIVAFSVAQVLRSRLCAADSAMCRS